MEKTCFVIIGFGIKTDFETGRSLNLDRTFENIIKPVFDDLDILCYRACDLEQSGVIDKKMYENILKADFVVADISTLNPNAIYELGVRHALKPNTTIVIAEDKLKIPFDVNHVFIHSYKHLEEDIGVTEAERFKAHLKKQVEKFIAEPEVDSPIYTFIPNLIPPSFTEDEIEDIKESIDKSHSTSDLVEQAEKKKNEKKYDVAKDLLKAALLNKPNDSFIIQRLALITYKSKEPSELEALNEALGYLEQLNPIDTTDPETLGLLGAINKRLYEQTNDENFIDKSRHYYERGFYVKQDYYNGINVAFLYLLKASLSENKFDIYANYGQARKVWIEIITKWSRVVESDKFEDRGDKEWIYLTLAEAHFGLQNKEQEERYFELAIKLPNTAFARASYNDQKEKLSIIINQKTLKKLKDL
ncbi:tetratricopeptide repeat-containing protein [Bizionia myxarmorum]|uniref:DUF4071 domain-containing protein n=1 Tax=Bizionia myxarmorum TaxID=291186 RepID=A0A5D0R5Y0_9FLAO|nr:tetratricopeptide repeat-containing protein [Bizionia myxarmorum]TYB76296.1 DUF4071 domain-containing protein [Bizionia myxarmorum]